MRLRALPQSFWKQPNVPNPVSPAPLFPSLPPLGSKDSSEDITGEFLDVKKPFITYYKSLLSSAIISLQVHKSRSMTFLPY